MASSKVFGIDKILIYVIKDCLFVILLLLTFIINVIFEFDTFFLVWRIVEVISIFKVGDYDILGNNRSILLFFVFFKVCERIIYD